MHSSLALEKKSLCSFQANWQVEGYLLWNCFTVKLGLLDPVLCRSCTIKLIGYVVQRYFTAWLSRGVKLSRNCMDVASKVTLSFKN